MLQYLRRINILIPITALVVLFAWGMSSVYAEDTKAGISEQMHVASLFGKLDENSDGYISVEEAAGKIAPETFSQADTDHDGKLNMAEFTAARIDKATKS